MSISLEEVNRKIDQLALQVEALTNAFDQFRLSAGHQQGSQGYPASVPPAPSAASASEARSVSSDGNYNLLAGEIPALPDFAASLCGRLSGGALSPRARAERAWESGWWARFALGGRIGKPRPSKPINLSNSCWIVLRAAGYQCPLLVTRASDYRSIVKNFDSPSISHGFPSQSEAKVFCLGAGVEYPQQVFTWSPRH